MSTLLGVMGTLLIIFSFFYPELDAKELNIFMLISNLQILMGVFIIVIGFCWEQ